MKNYALVIILMAGLVFGTATTSPATNIQDPSTSGELNLYQIYNIMYGTGFTSSNELYNARGIGYDEIWKDSDGTGQMRAVYSGGSQTFGFYTGVGSPSIAKTPIYTHATGVASFVNPGSASIDPKDGSGNDLLWGLYDDLTFGGNTYNWHSEDWRNSDVGDHMVALWIPNVTTTWNSSSSRWEYQSGDQNDRALGKYLVAFENLPLGSANCDYDYQDIVAQVNDANPVPEPGTLLLLGTGLAGLAGYGLRRKKK